MAHSSNTHTTTRWQEQFIAEHKLPAHYLRDATLWFEPLASSIANTRTNAARPVIVGVNGCQGSGKTTLCDYLCHSLNRSHGLSAIALSLDDFYLTQEERAALAENIHPLFRTRGVPGTHDHHLLQQTLAALTDHSAHNEPPNRVAIPRFDKATDERVAPEEWEEVDTPTDVVLLEGWCMGATAQPQSALQTPINALEREKDPLTIWRQYSNTVLERNFKPLYESIDLWIMMGAPSFDAVLGWRTEQERKLAPSTHSMSDEAVAAFVCHFERITRHCLEKLSANVHHLHQLDAQRRIVGYRYNPSASTLTTGSPAVP